MQNPNVIRTRSAARPTVAAREMSWSLMLLIVACAFVVAAGFFFAARQHFTSMEYGLKNSKLREQLQNLEAEKRRLLLAREVAHSPVAISRAARGLGMRETSNEVVTAVRTSAKSAPVDKEPSLAVAGVEGKKPSSRTVIPIVMTAPAPARSNGESRSRIVDTSKDKKEKVEVASLVKLR